MMEKRHGEYHVHRFIWQPGFVCRADMKRYRTITHTVRLQAPLSELDELRRNIDAGHMGASSRERHQILACTTPEVEDSLTAHVAQQVERVFQSVGSIR